MDDVARVVLALETPQVAEEVLHFLDRSGRARVVATAEDGRQLAEAVRQLGPDAVVAEPMLAIAGIEGPALLALATRESVSSLRAAVRAGASGFYVWPGERETLLEGLAAVHARSRRAPARRASVVAVHASRGGAGCTFVATHLAQAFERQGASCVLVDLDLGFGDVTHALGAGEDSRTIADLVPVTDELTWEHVDGVRWRGAVLAPPVEALASVSASLVRAAVEVAAAEADVVVLHLPRALDETTRWALAHADRILEVLSLDVQSFRSASRVLDVLSPLDLRDRVAFVVNRAARGEITPGDVRRIFGADPMAVVPMDASIPRAQDHGRLLAPRGRIGRTFARLATRLVEPVEEQAA